MRLAIMGTGGVGGYYGGLLSQKGQEVIFIPRVVPQTGRQTGVSTPVMKVSLHLLVIGLYRRDHCISDLARGRGTA